MDIYIAIQWIQKLAKMTEACKISHENTTNLEVHRLSSRLHCASMAIKHFIIQLMHKYIIHRYN